MLTVGLTSQSISVRTVIVCETSAKFLLISYSSTFGIQIDWFWPRQVGRTATKLFYMYVTQNSLHFIASRRDSRRHFECNFFKSPHYVPPGIRWEDPNGVGESGGWATALLSPRPHSFRFKKRNRSPPKPIKI